MKWVILFVLVLNFLPPATLRAQSVSYFYDQTTLEEAQQHYQKSMQKGLDILIKPYLTAQEKKKLAQVKLEIPLVYDLPTTEMDESYFPFGAYASARTNRIVIPALTLKFLYDLNLAIAWLYVHDCSLETPFEYISMLKYRKAVDFPNQRYPLPLDALQIPKDAINDPEVDALGLLLFNYARAFILAHELGHIYYQHSGNPPYSSPEQSRRQESEADRFAVDVLSRSGTNSAGVIYLVMAMAHYAQNRWDFDTNAEWEAYLMKSSHPLSAERIYTLATTIEENIETIVRFEAAETSASNARETIRSTIDDMVKVAQALEDKELQRAITLSVPSNDHLQEGLAPRCKTSLSPTASTPSLAFDGIYAGDYIRQVGNETETLPIRIMMRRNQNVVLGYFNFGLGNGFLVGDVRGNNLYFRWQWATASGNGNFYASEDGNSFEGEWGYRQSSSNGGQWTGRKE